uniref:transglycosylase domain-containing protein n=1 Tax=Okeania sp. SIO2F4 TaxID=2607790 RepID=UPI0025E5340F
MTDKEQKNIKEIFSETEADIIRKSKYIESQVRSNKNHLNSASNMLDKKDILPRKAHQLDEIKNKKKQANATENKISKNSINVNIKEILFTRKLWLRLGLIGISSIVIYGGWQWRKLQQSLPEIADISSYSRDGTLTIKAADGKIIQQTGPATREKIKLEDIPTPLVQAFIAIEDRRFYEHKGVDYQGVLRAFVFNIIARDVVQGGSTITQQLARMVFLDMEQTIWRKLREAMLAWKMEKELSKEEILELYLNIVYLGSGAYGVTDAAWVYFSKPVSGLTLAEMATLAGLPPAPSQYSPLVNPEAAKGRRNIVLAEMQKAGLISDERAKTAIAKPMEVQPSAPKRLIVEAPYFGNYIQKELPKYVSPEVLARGGLTVETTLDRSWQKIGEKIIQE